jgi:hypothetical protein
MHCDLFAVAEATSIDITTNRLSTFNLWDEINAASLPTMVPGIAIVMMLTREESEPANPEIQIAVSHNSRTLAHLPVTASFETKMKTRIVATVQGMVFTEQGVYEVAAHHGDERLGVWRIQVNLISSAAQPQIQVVGTAPVSPPGTPSDESTPR